MKVLIACEESQAVCKAFRERGHEAYSCDIQEPSGGHPEWHILGDALVAVEGGCIITMDGVRHEVGKWDLLIAHPPCTFLSNAGASHLFKGGKLNEERYKKGLEAKEFFMRFYNADVPMICVENPVPTRVYELPPYTQIVQPYEHGHPYSKRTCLWLKGLPKLQPTEVCEKWEGTTVAGNWYNKGGKDRQKNRSKTFPGIAAAMAAQWGNLKEEAND